MKVEKYSEFLFAIKYFLSEDECLALIAFSEKKGFQEAKVAFPGGAIAQKGIRDNHRLQITDSSLAQLYFDKAKSFLPSKLDGWFLSRFHESIRFYRYSSSQRFKMHQDGRVKGNDVEESRLTFLVYLNSNFQGGETRFREHTITPQTGKALCFLHEFKHEGTKVIQGLKYVLRFDVLYRPFPF